MGRTAARQVASQPLLREPAKGIDGLWKFRSSFLAPIVENPVIGFGQPIGPKCDRDRRCSSEIWMVGIGGIIHPLPRADRRSCSTTSTVILTTRTSMPE